MIDDLIPVESDTLSPAFSKCKGNQLWVILLEKAYAKIHGSYSRLTNAVLEDILRDFTGAGECITNEFSDDLYDLDDPQTIEDWKSQLQNEGLQLVLRCQSIDQGILNELSLVREAGYTILNIQKVRTLNETPYIVQIRNPFNTFKWEGDWGPESELWTDEIRDQCSKIDDEYTTFWVDFRKIPYFFDKIQVFQVNENWGYSSLKTKNSVGFYKFDIVAPGNYVFTVTQKSKI